MDGKLALPLAFLRVQSRQTHLLAQVSSLVVLHTHLFPKCWAILALSWHVIVELFWLLQQSCYHSRSPPPHGPKFPFQTTVLF